MARIKDKDFKDFTLTEAEFEYIKAAHVARNRVYEEQGRVLSSFLYYVAGSRLGYKTGQNLEFQVDFEDNKRTLKIKELPADPLAQSANASGA